MDPLYLLSKVTSQTFMATITEPHLGIAISQMWNSVTKQHTKGIMSYLNQSFSN